MHEIRDLFVDFVVKSKTARQHYLILALEKAISISSRGILPIFLFYYKRRCCLAASIEPSKNPVVLYRDGKTRFELALVTYPIMDENHSIKLLALSSEL